jgi:hypothetical protein
MTMVATYFVASLHPVAHFGARYHKRHDPRPKEPRLDKLGWSKHVCKSDPP